MMTTVVYATVPKITLVLGSYFGSESYAVVMDVRYFEYWVT